MMQFEDQCMTGTTFSNVDLSNTTFDNVNLSGAKFNNINLSSTIFTDVNMSGSTIDEACVSGMKVWGVDIEAAVRAEQAKQNPAGQLAGATPVLPARNLAESLAFYVEKLGFTRRFEDNPENPTYCGITRDGINVHLFAFEDKNYADNTMVRFSTRNIEALYKEYSDKEVIHPNGALQVKPWGSTEFSVIDPSGVCITFVAV